MTAVACTQPGCGGTIQDGYCDVCGLAPAPPPAASPAVGWGPAQNAGSIRYAGGVGQAADVAVPVLNRSAAPRLDRKSVV